MFIPPEILTVFVRGDWQKGLLLLCEDRAKKAMKQLLSASADNMVAVAKAQAEHEIFASLLPQIPQELQEFLAAEATAKGKP